MSAPLRPPYYPWSGRALLLDTLTRRWLFRPGALTAGLRGLGRVDLRVTREFSAGLTRMDSLTLPGLPGSPVWVREVIMAIDGVDCVSARSLTPLAASHSVWSGMRRLHTRPLADMLYGDRTVTRSAFTWRQLAAGDPFWYAMRRHIRPGASAPGQLHTPTPASAMVMPDSATLTHGQVLAPRLTLASWPALLARQSVFLRQGQPLLVQECFLPAFWQAAAQARR